jgi:CTP synthase (UTP-ammonia lyase)
MLQMSKKLEGLDAILVAQVLGRGIEGKLEAVRYARENKCRSSEFVWGCKWQ